jgi:hypothetical protein
MGFSLCAFWLPRLYVPRHSSRQSPLRLTSATRLLRILHSALRILPARRVVGWCFDGDTTVIVRYCSGETPMCIAQVAGIKRLAGLIFRRAGKVPLVTAAAGLAGTTSPRSVSPHFRPFPCPRIRMNTFLPGSGPPLLPARTARRRPKDHDISDHRPRNPQLSGQPSLRARFALSGLGRFLGAVVPGRCPGNSATQPSISPERASLSCLNPYPKSWFTRSSAPTTANSSARESGRARKELATRPGF